MKFPSTITSAIVLLLTATTYSEAVEPQLRGISSVASVESGSEVEKENLASQIWKVELSKVARAEQATMFFCVPNNGMVPNMTYAKSQGPAAMEALALSTNTKWKQIRGVQVFTQFDRDSYDFQADANTVSNWVALLPKEHQISLVYGHLPLSFMDQKTLRALLATQYDPDMRFVLLDKRQQSTLHLDLIPKIELQGSAATRRPRPFVSLIAPNLSDQTIPSGPNRTQPTSFNKLDKAPVGSLGFGDGEVLTLKKLADRASKVFGRTYVLSENEGKKRYFLSHGFNQLAFESAFNEAKSPQKRPKILDSRPTNSLSNFTMRLLQARPDLQKLEISSSYLRDYWARKQASSQQDATLVQVIIDRWTKEYGSSETLPLSDFLRNTQTSVDLLNRERPGLAKELEAAGMKMNDKVLLGISLQLVIEAPGQHESSLIGFMKENQFIRAMIPNKVSMGIS